MLNIITTVLGILTIIWIVIDGDSSWENVVLWVLVGLDALFAIIAFVVYKKYRDRIRAIKKNGDAGKNRLEGDNSSDTTVIGYEKISEESKNNLSKERAIGIGNNSHFNHSLFNAFNRIAVGLDEEKTIKVFNEIMDSRDKKRAYDEEKLAQQLNSIAEKLDELLAR